MSESPALNRWKQYLHFVNYKYHHVAYNSGAHLWLWIGEPESVSCFKVFEKPSFQHTSVEYSKTVYPVMWKVVGGCRKSVWGNVYLPPEPKAPHFYLCCAGKGLYGVSLRWGGLKMKWRFFKKKADNPGGRKIKRQPQEAFWDPVVFHVGSNSWVGENKSSLKYKGSCFKLQVEGTMWCDIKNYYYG